jgi:hypothetical protein
VSCPRCAGPGRQGRLLRDDVEAYALAQFRARRYKGPDSYFVTTAGIAELLSISGPRVIQLGDKGYLPYLVAGNSWRLYRRHQTEVIAKAPYTMVIAWRLTRSRSGQDAFGLVVGVMTLHPFAREVLQDVTGRLGYPPFTLDLLLSPLTGEDDDLISLGESQDQADR